MSNDPRDSDGRKLREAMRLLGRDPALRKRLVESMRTIENDIRYSGPVRDDIIGPIVDALHEDGDVYDKELADGTRIRYFYRTKIARDLLLSGAEKPTHVWEPQTTKLLLEMARQLQGDVIVGGAYFGDQAILVAKAVAAKGLRVHCFEPNEEQAGMLRKNIELNHLTNIDVNIVGLWERSGDNMRLDGFDSFANAVLVGDGEGFKTVSIDDYMAEKKCRIGMIQMDIEGAELSALKGARNTLERDRPVVIFELHRSYVDWSNGLRATPICDLLLKLGYEVYAVRDINSHREMEGKPVELVPIDTVFLEGPPHGFNMLAIPSRELVQSTAFRLVEAVSPKLLPHKDPHLHHPVGGF